MKPSGQLKRSGPPKRRAELKRRPPKSSGRRKPYRKPKGSPRDFDEQTKAAARRRSGGRCEANSSRCTGRAAHFHHRQSRRHGDQRLENCLHVCLECHDYIHFGSPTVAYVMGWMVHSYDDPAEIPLRRGDGPGHP